MLSHATLQENRVTVIADHRLNWRIEPELATYTTKPLHLWRLRLQRRAEDTPLRLASFFISTQNPALQVSYDDFDSSQIYVNDTKVHLMGRMPLPQAFVVYLAARPIPTEGGEQLLWPTLHPTVEIFSAGALAELLTGRTTNIELLRSRQEEHPALRAAFSVFDHPQSNVDFLNLLGLMAYRKLVKISGVTRSSSSSSASIFDRMVEGETWLLLAEPGSEVSSLGVLSRPFTILEKVMPQDSESFANVRTFDGRITKLTHSLASCCAQVYL